MRIQVEIKYPVSQRYQEDLEKIIHAIVHYVIENPNYHLTISKEKERLAIDIYVENPLESTKSILMNLVMGLKRIESK